MLIGKLSAESGLSRDTIRYYEKLGLLDSAVRHDNNYKNYSLLALQQLINIGQLKDLGFTLTEIADILKLAGSSAQPCASLPEELDQKLARIEDQIMLLTSYRDRLQAVRKACSVSCQSTRGLPQCFGPDA